MNTVVCNRYFMQWSTTLVNPWAEEVYEVCSDFPPVTMSLFHSLTTSCSLYTEDYE